MFERLQRLRERLVRKFEKWAAESGRLDWYYFDEIPDSEIERYEPRQISSEQAEYEILGYLKEHRGKDSFDIALALHLDPTFARDVCNNLLKKGKISLI